MAASLSLPPTTISRGKQLYNGDLPVLDDDKQTAQRDVAVDTGVAGDADVMVAGGGILSSLQVPVTSGDDIRRTSVDASSAVDSRASLDYNLITQGKVKCLADVLSDVLFRERSENFSDNANGNMTLVGLRDSVKAFGIPNRSPTRQISTTSSSSGYTSDDQVITFASSVLSDEDDNYQQENSVGEVYERNPVPFLAYSDDPVYVNDEDETQIFKQEASIVFKKTTNHKPWSSTKNIGCLQRDGSKIVPNGDNNANFADFSFSGRNLLHEVRCDHVPVISSSSSSSLSSSSVSASIFEEDNVMTMEDEDKPEQGALGSDEGKIIGVKDTVGEQVLAPPFVILVLWVVIFALVLSHPWSVNLSSGLVAAALYFSLNTPSPGPPVDPEKEENQQDNSKSQKREEDRVQKDRCIEVYPETVRQRQRNTMTSSNKVDIKNWTSSSGNDTLTSPSKVKKFLPSVKALRNQFETGKTNNNKTETNGNNTTNGNLSRKSSVSNSSVASSSIEKTSSTNSLNSGNGSVENLHSSNIENSRPIDPDEPVEPIFSQFKKVDEELRELMSKPPSTTGWNPRPLLKRLYYVPDAPKHHSQGTTYINIEGYLEKLPSGRKKATFWNAWKRRYFVAKDGVLYYYQNPQADKASMKMTLMGGKVECMEPSMVGVDDGSRDSKAGAMIGIDDGKGHYVVVRCSSKQEAERWRRALETHTVEDFASQYVQPWPIPTNPTMLRDTLIIDLGSSSVRAGVLASQATLPQVFVPSVVATERETRRQIWGFDALSPDVRSVSSISFPIRPSHKISKYSVDLSAVSSLLQKAFADLKVDPKNYNVQLSVPRILNPNTQAELLRVLFDKYGVKSVNLTHQSILALYAYNATSGIVVDIGERLDIVPVIDGYIVDGGVSRVPYGGYRILDHLRQFLYMRNISLINEVESYIIRHVLENICYCAHHYNTEKARCTNNPDNYEKGVSLAEYFPKDCPFEYIALDFGRFQATEGLFNPDAWGLDHPGIHKLVHKAIMECSMDIRKEMSRSIFLAGGVTQLPGLVERLTTEIDNLTPPAIRPKVHASPYRYHAAYIGACVLAESPAFTQSRITREDWNKHGNAALKKWSL